MFGKWRERRRAKAEHGLRMQIAILWARGDFESRWIAWHLFMNEVGKDWGDSAARSGVLFFDGSTIADMLRDAGYPDGAFEFSAMLVQENFSWGQNNNDPADPLHTRKVSIEEILGPRAAAYRTAFHRFQQSLP